MPVTFHTKLYSHYEGLSVISGIVNNETNRKIYDKFVKAGKVSEADLLAGELFNIYEHVKQNFDTANPKLIEFFKHWDEDGYKDMSFATAMTFLYSPNRIPQMVTDFAAKDETAQKKLIAEALLSHNEEQPEYPIEFDAVIKKIDSLPVNTDTKYKLVKIYHTYYESLCYLSDTLDEVAVIIADKIKPLRKKAAEVMLELEKKSNGDTEYLSKVVSMAIRFSPETVIDVYPTAFTFGAVVHSLFLNTPDRFSVIWGYKLEQVLQIVNEIERSAGQSIDALRAMTEKTKFEILSALMGGPLYGTELAQRMGLTGATVSHHVSELLRHGIICANPEQTKVYYSINKKQIKEILQGMERYFDGEGIRV